MTFSLPDVTKLAITCVDARVRKTQAPISKCSNEIHPRNTPSTAVTTYNPPSKMLIP